MLHILKIQRRFYDDVASGKKTFEVRNDDRCFRVGDLIRFNVFEPNEDGADRATEGNVVKDIWVVTYKLNAVDFPSGLKPGYCVLSIERVK